MTGNDENDAEIAAGWWWWRTPADAHASPAQLHFFFQEPPLAIVSCSSSRDKAAVSQHYGPQWNFIHWPLKLYTTEQFVGPFRIVWSRSYSRKCCVQVTTSLPRWGTYWNGCGSQGSQADLALATVQPVNTRSSAKDLVTISYLDVGADLLRHWASWMRRWIDATIAASAASNDSSLI